MKTTYFLSFLFLVLLFISGCKSNPVHNNPVELELRKGQIQLNFDKNSVPDGIVLVKATLTRENHNPIIADLNITSDTTATILIQDIAIGSWHLLVQAFDNNNSVVYEGETTVNINENQITQVSLILQPMQSGTGSIIIQVTWGIANNNNWIDYHSNPIFSPMGNTYDLNGIAGKRILYDDNEFKMWFTTFSSVWTGNVFYAKSTNGINWQRISNIPVLQTGSYGQWDSYEVGVGDVIRINDSYYMYYVGRASSIGSTHVGLAVSTDGQTWTKYGTPVLSAATGWESSIGATQVLKIGNNYYLFYHGKDGNNFKIGLAISTDGINWTRYQNNPILTATETWEGDGIYNVNIFKENNLYKMVYMVSYSTQTSLGMAFSSDGIHWTKYNNNPFFTVNNLNNNWAGLLGYPTVVKVGSKYHLYYSARTGPWVMGLAIKE